MGGRGSGRPARIWYPNQDAVLGTDTDLIVADRLGIPARSVADRRKHLGATHRQRRGLLKLRYPNGPCWICGRPGDWLPDNPDPLTADHVQARAQGGTHSELRPAHRSCNSARGAA